MILDYIGTNSLRGNLKTQKQKNETVKQKQNVAIFRIGEGNRIKSNH